MHIKVSKLFVSLAPLANFGAFRVEERVLITAVVSTPLVPDIYISGFLMSLAPLADLGAFHVEDWIDRLAAVVSTPLVMHI
jgi:hypothetical protein